MTMTDDYPPLTVIDGGVGNEPQRPWACDELVLVKSPDLSAADVAAMTGRTLAAIRHMRHNHGVKSTRPAGTWGISEADVADAHSGADDEWPYPWVRDGLTYSYCIRCAIRMELPESQLWSANPREYCIACDVPEFRLKPHGWNRMQDARVAAA